MFFQMYKFDRAPFFVQAPQKDQNDDCAGISFCCQGRMVQGTPVYDDTRHLVETVQTMVPKSCQWKLVANDQLPGAMLFVVHEDVESKNVRNV